MGHLIWLEEDFTTFTEAMSRRKGRSARPVTKRKDNVSLKFVNWGSGGIRENKLAGFGG